MVSLEVVHRVMNSAFMPPDRRPEVVGLTTTTRIGMTLLAAPVANISVAWPDALVVL